MRVVPGWEPALQRCTGRGKLGMESGRRLLFGFPLRFFPPLQSPKFCDNQEGAKDSSGHVCSRDLLLLLTVPPSQLRHSAHQFFSHGQRDLRAFFSKMSETRQAPAASSHTRQPSLSREGQERGGSGGGSNGGGDSGSAAMC